MDSSHEFIIDVVEKLNGSVTEAKQLLDIIACVTGNEADVIRKLINHDLNKKNHRAIRVSVINVAKETAINNLVYNALMFHTFVRYKMDKNYCSLITCNEKNPFTRLMIDFDVENDCNRTEQEIIDWVFQVAGNCLKPKYVVTRRDKRESRNFHLIFEQQFDRLTVMEITKLLIGSNEDSSVKIDMVTSWFFPTGRDHRSSEMDTYEKFKLLSPIDVWSENNFLTCLVPCHESECERDTLTLTWENKELKWVADEKLKEPSIFFAKFISYCVGKLSPDATEAEKMEFHKQPIWQFSFGHSDNRFTYSELLECFHAKKKIPMGKSLPGMLDTQNEYDYDEFYESIFNSEIEYETEALNIFIDPVAENQVRDVHSIDLNNVCVQSEIENKLMFLKRPLNNPNWTDRMKSFRTHPFRVSSETWNIASRRIFGNIENLGNFLHVFLTLYKNYMQTYKLPYPCHDYIEDITSDSIVGNQNDHELVEILKSAFTLMLNSMCVTSLISLLLRSDIYNIDSVYCSVLLLNSLDISEKARYILLGYLSEVCEPHLKGLRSSLVDLFYGNDLIYFFFENYASSNGEKEMKFQEIFQDSEEEDQQPRKKKFKPSFFKFHEIFYKYITPCVINGTRVCGYESGYYEKLDCESNCAKFAYPVNTEPMTLVYWYRRDLGIYFSITQMFELNTPSYYSLIGTPTASMYKNYGNDLYDTRNFKLKSFLLDCLLKARHFIKVVEMNEIAVILLEPIDDRDGLDYPISLTNICAVDLNCSKKLPSTIYERIKSKPTLCKTINYLGCIVAELSQKCQVDLKNRASFVEKTFVIENECDADTMSGAQSLITSLPIFDHMKRASKMETSTFLQMLKHSVGKMDVETSNYEGSPALTITKPIKNTGEMNYFMLKHFFNGSVGNGLEIDFNDHEYIDFLLFVLSWYIRCFDKHVLSSTAFFKHVEENRKVLYDELKDVLKFYYGNLMINRNPKDLAHYFGRFCKNTKVSVPDRWANKIPHGYELGVKSCGRFENEIYIAIVCWIVQSQFSIDSFVDLIKLTISFTHSGNTLRRFMGLLKRTASGKNQFVTFLISHLFPSKIERQMFVNNDLQTADKNTGNFLAIPLTANLLTWFDEVTKLNDDLKCIINNSVLSEREMRKGKYSSFVTRSSVVITANGDPKGKDAATNLRMLPMDRFLQYVELRCGLNVVRYDSIVDPTLSPINEHLGIQMLVERLPASGETEITTVGSYFLIWSLSDLFFFNFKFPVSQKHSETMEKRLLEFLFIAQPYMYIIRNKMFKFSATHEMDVATFDKKIIEIFNKNRGIFMGIDQSKALSELKDTVNQYMSDDKTKIYVEFTEK